MAVNNQGDCGCGNSTNTTAAQNSEIGVAQVGCPQCALLFAPNTDYLCVNIMRTQNQPPPPVLQSLWYGVRFAGVEIQGADSIVTYTICNCNLPGTTQAGISHVNFEFCPGEGALFPDAALVNGQQVVIENGDAFFTFPNFKVEGFASVESQTCIQLQLRYNGVILGIEDFVQGNFGVKIGGGPIGTDTAGSVFGLLVPCRNVTPPDEPCDTVVFQEVCATAQVTVVPSVISLGTSVSCIGDPIINNGTCPERFSTTNCTFTVTQIMCVRIPLRFQAHVNPITTSMACAEPTTTSCLPTPPPPPTPGNGTIIE